MSLINEALKRAKEAQQQVTVEPSSGPVLRPVEPAQMPPQSFRLLPPISLGIIFVLGVILVLQVLQKGRSGVAAEPKPLTVAAAKPAPEVTGPVSQPVSQPTPAPSGKQPSAPAVQQAAAKAPSTVPAAPASTAQQTAVAPATPAITAAPVIAQPVAPAPPPLKLQGIVYNPARPSALISGRTLFVGDRFDEMKVTRISQSQVVLVGSGKTNVLTLMH